MTNGVARSHQAGEVIVATHNDVTIGDVAKGPGASLPVLIAIELGNHTERILLRETQYFEEDSPSPLALLPKRPAR